jgi:hypothetical protein
VGGEERGQQPCNVAGFRQLQSSEMWLKWTGQAPRMKTQEMSIEFTAEISVSYDKWLLLLLFHYYYYFLLSRCFYLVLLFLNQWWTPPLRLHDCNAFLTKHNFPSTFIFYDDVLNVFLVLLQNFFQSFSYSSCGSNGYRYNKAFHITHGIYMLKLSYYTFFWAWGSCYIYH